MRKLLILFLVSIVLCIQASAVQQDDLLNTWYTWAPLNAGTIVSLEDRHLNLQSQGNFSGVYNQRLLSLILEETDLLSFEMKTSVKGEGNVFFSTYNQSKFDQNRKLTFYLGRPNRWKTYYFNLAPYKEDWGRVDYLLLNPFTGQGTAQIRSLRVVKGNIYQKFLAAVQEFLGPQGRKIVGYTINTMQNPVLFGKNIFYYLYGMLGLVFLIILAGETKIWLAAKKKAPFQEIFLRIGKNMFIAVLILWLLLEMSSWYTNWLNLQDDLPLLGKSLDEKRAMVNTGDFYAFIKFCEDQIPNQATFDIRIPPLYNDIKANYYLLPRFRQKDGEYMVVYDKPVEDEVWHNYEMQAKFRDGAFILRRKRKQ